MVEKIKNGNLANLGLDYPDLTNHQEMSAMTACYLDKGAAMHRSCRNSPDICTSRYIYSRA